MDFKEDIKERFLGIQKRKCRICGAEGGFRTFLVREMMYGTRDEFEYFECGECGCLQITEVPENLNHYYQNDYYSFKTNSFDDDFLKNEITDMRKILDVGCGTGANLIELAKKGYGNLYGCDPFIENDINYGGRIYIRKCTIEKLNDFGSYDHIIMSDSLEHTTNPLEVLQCAKRLINKSGVIEISIPVYPNIAFDLFGTHWYQLDAPRHITLHSIRSIRFLIREAGLKIERFKWDSEVTQITRSFFYKHGISFFDITAELQSQYFTQKDMEEIERVTKKCNEEGYGDHIYMRLNCIDE